MTEYIQISTTTETEQQARTIAEALVQRRLAACVQIAGPMRSIYRWQGAVEQAEEWLCTAKSRATLFGKVEAAIVELHSYECPEIIAVPIIDGSAPYLKWLGEQIG